MTDSTRDDWAELRAALVCEADAYGSSMSGPSLRKAIAAGDALLAERDRLAEENARLRRHNYFMSEEIESLAAERDTAHSQGEAEGLERAAKICEEADRQDEIDNGAAATGAAFGLATVIRALAKGAKPT